MSLISIHGKEIARYSKHNRVVSVRLDGSKFKVFYRALISGTHNWTSWERAPADQARLRKGGSIHSHYNDLGYNQQLNHDPDA